MKPCGHANADHTTGCHWCGLYATRSDYRELWDSGGPDHSSPTTGGNTKRGKEKFPNPLRKLPKCVHLGVILVPCHGCRSDKRHVHDCEVHGTCTPTECGKDVDMTCDRCRRDGLGYETKTGIGVKSDNFAPQLPSSPGTPAQI